MLNVGLDVHQKYTYYTELDDVGRVIRQGKVANEGLPALFSDGEERQVALESTRNWYCVVDSLEGVVSAINLSHPLKTRAIAEARIKTDKVDSAILAHLLRTNLLPTAYIAPVSVREQRELLRFRASLTGLRTAVKNKIHAILAKRGLQPPYSDIFGKKGRRWLDDVDLPPVYRLVLDGYLEILDAIGRQIDDVTIEIQQRASLSPEAQLLMSIPGVSFYSALLILAEIGEVARFPDRRHLVSYAGLAPIVRSSGGKTHYGPISKQGSPWLRWILIQAAHTAARCDPAMREIYRRTVFRRGTKVASVALARHLLKVVYQVLKTKVPYERDRSSSYCS